MENTPLTTLKYSAFLGGLYPSDAATEAKIAEAKLAVGGETVVKRGFTGYDGDGPSAQAIRLLGDAGIKSVKMSGPLTAVRIVEKTVNGIQARYLNVTLGTSAGKQFLSVDATNKAAQDLIRRLVDAVPGADTEISLYARYGQRDGAPRAFADHFASAKQNGSALKGANPADMWPIIRAAQEPLKATGFADKAMLSAVQNKVTLSWHLDLAAQIASKFAAYYEQRASASAESAPAPVVAASSPAIEEDPFGIEASPPVALPPPTQPVVRQPVADPFALI
jgi:hypothetical protein